jgi:ankyrin repeat protein
MVIASHAARAYLSVGLTEEAKKYFYVSIEFETIREGEEGVEWPSSETSLNLLYGLAGACQKSGDLEKALEALKSALPLSERLFGEMSEKTVAIVSRLKDISERQEVMQRHHKSVITASKASSRDFNFTKSVQSSPGPQEEGSQQGLLEVPVNQRDEAEGQQELDLEGELMGASSAGDEPIVRLLLGLPNIEPDPKDNIGRTPLSHAAARGHEAVVKLLLETGKAKVDLNDRLGQTPLSRAAEQGHEAVVKLLLETGKAKVDSKDNNSKTPLLRAAEQGHEAIVKLLLETGKAKVDSKDRLGQTPLSKSAEQGHEAVVKLLQSSTK